MQISVRNKSILRLSFHTSVVQEVFFIELRELGFIW